MARTRPGATPADEDEPSCRIYARAFTDDPDGPPEALAHLDQNSNRHHDVAVASDTAAHKASTAIAGSRSCRHPPMGIPPTRRVSVVDTLVYEHGVPLVWVKRCADHGIPPALLERAAGGKPLQVATAVAALLDGLDGATWSAWPGYLRDIAFAVAELHVPVWSLPDWVACGAIRVPGVAMSACPSRGLRTALRWRPASVNIDVWCDQAPALYGAGFTGTETAVLVRLPLGDPARPGPEQLAVMTALRDM